MPGILSFVLNNVAKPLLGTVISKPAPGESVMQKNFRPYLGVGLVALVLLSEFTSYVMSDQLLTAIGAILAVMVAGRSYEKKANKAFDAFDDLQKKKREERDD